MKAEKDLTGFATRKSIVDDTLTLYGINPNVPATEGNSAQAQSIAQLRGIVDTQVESEQQNTGRCHQRGGAGDRRAGPDPNRQHAVVLLAVVAWRHVAGAPIEKRMIDATIDDVPADIRARIEKNLRGRHYDDDASWTSSSRS